ncbi:MAG: FHA domain-containing protein [Polyangiaceae bacterium]
MKPLRIRYLRQELELEDGEYLVGRSASCQISLDDPLASRNHAKLVVVEGQARVEDLGSRNGVRVNGERVSGHSKVLEPGDRIGVGSQELLVLGPREAVTDLNISRGAPTHRFDRFAVVGTLAEKALAMGRGEEAERILGMLLADTLREVESGRIPIGIDQAGYFAYRLADATGKGSWVDYIVALYHGLKRPIPAEVVDELYTTLRKVAAVDLPKLAAYVGTLRANVTGLSPAERFLVSRIEGLERLARAR